MKKEKWKWVKDFEGIYQVSNLARVRRVRLVPTEDPCLTKVEVVKMINVKFYDLQNDCKVTFNTTKSKKSYNLKTLVWQTFKGEVSGRIIHKDGDRKKCELSNLKQTNKYRDTEVNINTKNINLVKMNDKQIIAKANKLGISPKSLYEKKRRQLKKYE